MPHPCTLLGLHPTTHNTAHPLSHHRTKLRLPTTHAHHRPAIVRLVWAYARVGVPTDGLLPRIAQLCRAAPAALHPAELASLLWAAAASNDLPTGFLYSVGDAAAGHVRAWVMQPRDMLLVRGFTHLAVVPPYLCGHGCCCC